MPDSFMSDLKNFFRWHRSSAEKAGDTGDDAPVSWVTVMVLFDVAKAIILRSRLEDEGIPAQIRQESVSSALPVSIGIIGRMEILVPVTAKERAERILYDLSTAEDVDDWDDYDFEDEDSQQGE